MTDTATKAKAVKDALALVEQGMSANKAAASVGDRINVTARTVQRWAQDDGTPLGHASQDAAKNARDVHRAQYEARRAQVDLMLLDLIEDVGKRFNAPHIDYRGKDVTKVHWDTAPDSAVRNYSVSLGILIDKLRLEEGKATGRQENIGVGTAVRTIEEEIAKLNVQMKAND